MNMLEWNGSKLSKLCLGTVQFGINYGVANQSGMPSQKQVDTILDYVQNAGINCFDTAQLYGKSEAVLGEYLLKRPKATPNIISKVPSVTFDLGLPDFTDTIKDSLRQLHRSKLYGLLIHDAMKLANWSITDTKKIIHLKEHGHIEHFGVSIYTDDEFRYAVQNPDIDLIQIPYNLFDQRGIQNGWFELAKKHNKLLFVRSIYLQGLLLMDHNTIPLHLTHAKPFIGQLQSFCQELGMTRNELCLSFVNTTAKDSPLLFGCETILQAKENIDTFTKTRELTDNEIITLTKVFKNVDESIYNPSRWSH